MYKVICVFALLLFSSAQSCCGNPSVCSTGSTCLCQTGVDTCMFEITSDPRIFTVYNNNVSYYYWTPTTESYINIFLFFCPDITSNSLYYAGYYIQDEDGGGYPTNLTDNFASNASNTSSPCWMAQFVDQTFCKVSNGSYCYFMIAVQLSEPATAQLSIFIKSASGSSKFLIPVLVSVGVVLFVIVVVLVGCIIKRRLQAQRNAIHKADNDLVHFDQLLPKVTLQQAIRAHNLPQQVYNCSVCLFDLEAIDTVRRTPCGHIFHADCIDVWCKKNISCPMCRFPLDSDSLLKKAEGDQSSVLELVGIKPSKQSQETIQQGRNNRITSQERR